MAMHAVPTNAAEGKTVGNEELDRLLDIIPALHNIAAVIRAGETDGVDQDPWGTAYTIRRLADDLAEIVYPLADPDQYTKGA